MRLNLLRSDTLGSEQSPQSRILTSHNPRYALHLERSLCIATFKVTHAILKIVEQVSLTSARTTLVLARHNL
jgi:hypothetical protein